MAAILSSAGPPMTTATGMSSPLSWYFNAWMRPLWLSLRMSILVSFFERYMNRYMPQLMSPVSKSRETTLVSWIKA